MYTIKINNEQADIAISLTAEDIEKIASNMDVQLTDAQTQDVLTVFCSNILSDPDSIICTSTVESIIEKVVKN